MEIVKKEELSLEDEARQMLLEEVLEKVMPMIEKQLPQAEEALKKSLDGSSDGVEKTVVIRTSKTGVHAMVFKKGALTVEATEDPISVISSTDLIKTLISGGFKNI